MWIPLASVETAKVFPSGENSGQMDFQVQLDASGQSFGGHDQQQPQQNSHHISPGSDAAPHAPHPSPGVQLRGRVPRNRTDPPSRCRWSSVSKMRFLPSFSLST